MTRPTAREVVELLREHRQMIDDAGGWASRIPAERMEDWERKKRDLLARIEAHTPGPGDRGDGLEGAVAMTGVERWALRLVRIGLAVIALVTFITSFDAVSAVGAARGAVSPELAWAIPLALDGLIVVGSAVAWLESLRGGRWHPLPVALVMIAGALSVAANVAHASGTDPLARALAAVPPVALLAAVELGAWQLRREAHRTPAEQDCAPANGDAQLGSLWQRIAVEVARLDARPTQQAIADQLGVSRARVQCAIASNRDEWEQLHRNGEARA